MKRKCLSILLSLLLMLSMAQLPAAALTEQEASGLKEFYLIDDVAQLIQHYYKFGTTSEEMTRAALFETLVRPDSGLEGMLDSMMSALDPNSSYLNAEDYLSMMTYSITGEFAGIGVSIVQKNGKTIVVTPIAGTPAEAAGLKPDDVIFSVDGEDIAGYSLEKIQSMITGVEGTSVNIGVIREGKEIYFDIVRGMIKDQTVSHLVMEEDIGYIGISNFNQTTAGDTKIALDEFDALGIEDIIIDLRNNPGGSFDAVIELCGLLVPKGVVVHIEYKDPEENEIYYSELEKTKYNVVVLINEGSASASELFAAAMQDTGAGKLVGTTTYGKGTMQTLIPVYQTGGALRLTIAEYLSAGGRAVNEVGVSPDYYITNETERRDCSHFMPMDYLQAFSLGDEDAGVLALEQRLSFLGYLQEEPDTSFGEETGEALKTYQAYRGFAATGSADFETMFDLGSIDYEMLEFFIDKQMETALEVIGLS